MTIPEKALRAAQEATEGGFGITDDYMRAALTAALPFLTGVKVDPWVDTRLVRFDDTIAFGHGGFDFDRWESLRLEMHTRHGSFAVWQSDSKTWSMYGGKYGFLMLDRFSSEEEAKAEAEQIVISLDAAPSPRAQALEALFDAVTLMQKHDEKFEGEIPLATIQKVYAAHTAAMRALSQGTSSERAQALEEALRKMVALYESERDPGDYGFQRPDWLLAALSSQPVADGWLPIETAPKDGTVIDLWSSEFGRQPDCFWGKREHHCGEAGQYCDSDWHSEPDAWIDSAQNTQTFDDITHWHPLPASPRSSCACCEN